MTAILFTALGLTAMAGGLPTARIQTASIGIPDTLFLMLLALVVFGPRRLPEIGRQLGKLMYEFRKVSNDFRFQMEEELRASEEADRLRKVQAAAAPPVAAQVPLPVAAPESAPLELAAGLPAIDGEVRAEAPRVAPVALQIAPPATGEPVAAQRPFRGRFSEAGVELGSEPGVELGQAQEVAETPGTEEEVRHG